MDGRRLSQQQSKAWRSLEAFYEALVIFWKVLAWRLGPMLQKLQAVDTQAGIFTENALTDALEHVWILVQCCSILGHVFHHDPKKSNLTGGCLQYLITVYLVVLSFEVIVQNQICINIDCDSRVLKQLNSTGFARFMDIFRLATTTPRSASDRLPCMR